jgi:hypothetical protein
METKLHRDVRWLKAYAIVMTLLLGVCTFSAFQLANQKNKFSEIDVERINIVEKDGALKLVISNKERAPDPIIGGKTYPLRQGGNVAGMIFYNEQGDECGGLVFSGQEKDGVRRASAALLFDQFNQDQTIGFSYNENGGQRGAGFNVWDRPDTPIAEMMEKIQMIQKMPEGPEKTQALKTFRDTSGVAQRVFVGKTGEKAAVFMLADPQGHPRIRLMVDAQGLPKLEFMDEKGAVVYQLPAPTKASGKKKTKS